MEMDKIVYYLHYVCGLGDVVYYIQIGFNIPVGAVHPGFAKQTLGDCPLHGLYYNIIEYNFSFLIVYLLIFLCPFSQKRNIKKEN